MQTSVLNMPENEYSYDGDFYLDVDVHIFAYNFMDNCILLTSISCTPRLLIWRLRKNPLLVLLLMLDLCPASMSHLAPEAVSASLKMSLHS